MFTKYSLDLKYLMGDSVTGKVLSCQRDVAGRWRGSSRSNLTMVYTVMKYLGNNIEI